MSIWKIMGNELKKRKEAMIIGGLLGLGLAWYTINQGVDLQAIADAGKGAIDGLLGRNSSPLDMAKNKIYIVFGLVGAALGYYAELLLEKLGFVKKRR